MKCPICKQTYKNQLDIRLISSVGRCVHCLYEQETWPTFKEITIAFKYIVDYEKAFTNSMKVSASAYFKK